MKILKNISAVLLAFFAAFLIMTAFEFTNSFFYRFPAGMNTQDLDAVRAFTDTLPNTAYILVLAGWATASFLAGWLATRLASKKNPVPALIVAVLLTLCGLLNFWMLAHPVWVIVLGVPMFIGLPILGSKLARNKG